MRIQSGYTPGGGHWWCWRLYGLRPFYRLCLIDWTRGPRGADLRLLGRVVLKFGAGR